MTPSEISGAAQEVRQARLAEIREEVREMHPSKRGSVVDEAILIMLETLKYAKLDTPQKLPDRPIEYLTAMLFKAEEGTFADLLYSRACQIKEWVYELESGGTPSGRKHQLKTLLQQAGVLK